MNYYGKKEVFSKRQYIAVVVIAAALIFAVVYGSVYLGKGKKADYDLVRIHIRANSNSAEDQSVKYAVRDAVINLLTPLLAECEDTESAAAAIRGALSDIKITAGNTLRNNGLAYGVSAELRDEEFPTRIYDGVTYPAGVYRSLIVDLGEGAGDNWWCVAFPPLCFIPAEDDGTGTVKYRSKILEILKGHK